MNSFQDFVKKNKKEVHEILNDMWRTIERLALKLESVLPDIDLENAHGNFIKIDQGWDEAVYANPEIIYPYGVIGYSLDGEYWIFSVNPKKLSGALLAQIIALKEKTDKITLEIYGADDCFQTFYHSQDQIDLDTTITAIKQTSEQMIQLELNIEPFEDEEIKEALYDTGITLFTLLKENDSLAMLPQYQ